jgi:hypothetical protein
MFPSGFVFGMVTPLHLIHLDFASTGKMDVFFKDTNRSLPVGEVVVQVDGVVVDLLEGLGFIGDLKAFAELRNMEDIMELG